MTARALTGCSTYRLPVVLRGEKFPGASWVRRLRSARTKTPTAFHAVIRAVHVVAPTGGEVRKDLADRLVNNLLAPGSVGFNREPRREFVAEGQKLRSGGVDHGVDFLADIRDGDHVANQALQFKLITSQADLFTAGFNLGVGMPAESGRKWRGRRLWAVSSRDTLLLGLHFGNFPRCARQLPAGAGRIFAPVPGGLGLCGIELPIMGRDPASLHRLRDSFGADAVPPRELSERNQAHGVNRQPLSTCK
jgi:hypothetical protein